MRLTRNRWSLGVLAVVVLLGACGENSQTGMAPEPPNPPAPPGPNPPPAAPTDTLIGVPLIDMTGTYLSFEGGLYPGETNSMPQSHFDAGMRFASEIEPRDAGGSPDPGGIYTLMSLGMSNTRNHFATFLDRVAADPSVNPRLVVVNGAQGGQAAGAWVSPSQPAYDGAMTLLSQSGSSEQQVEILWILQANPQPSISLPSANADAFNLVGSLGEILRAAKIRYPNLKLVFFSSRIYSCARGGLNPEPYAYESGFSVKWLIGAQIHQMETGEIDPIAGTLNYDTGVAPWIAWGPYLWADDGNGRSDGLVWLDSDLVSDCTHPSASGTAKVADMLMDFFETSPLATGWFVN